MYNDPSYRAPEMQNPIRYLSRITQLSELTSTGCLNATFQASVHWQVYLENGELKYVRHSLQTASTLKIYLQQMGSTGAAALNSLKREPDITSIEWMRHCEAEGFLDAKALANLNLTLIKDAFESLIWISKANCVWKPRQTTKVLKLPKSATIKPLKLNIASRYFYERVKRWQKFNPPLYSPHQRLYLFDYHNLMQKAVESGKMSAKLHGTLSRLLRGLSLRQVSIFLKQDELKIAEFLMPYIQEGAIVIGDPVLPLNQLPSIPAMKNKSESKSLIPQPNPKQDQTPSKGTIVCIDDSPGMLDELERLLTPHGFHITKVNNPLKASAELFRVKPDLILMDVGMPGIDGNQLCKLLRGTELFRETPIVMVTGNQGMINKAKSRFSGATDYLTKPFTHATLIKIVNKNLKSPQ